MKQPPTKHQYNRAAALWLHHNLSASQSVACCHPERSRRIDSGVPTRLQAAGVRCAGAAWVCSPVYSSTPLRVTGVNTTVPLNRDSIDDDYILKYKVKVKKIN